MGNEATEHKDSVCPKARNDLMALKDWGGKSLKLTNLSSKREILISLILSKKERLFSQVVVSELKYGNFLYKIANYFIITWILVKYQNSFYLFCIRKPTYQHQKKRGLEIIKDWFKNDLKTYNALGLSGSGLSSVGTSNSMY